MDIDIRKAIKNNFKSSNAQEITATINEAIASREEKALPGLGVFLEVLWQSASPQDKEKIVNALAVELKK